MTYSPYKQLKTTGGSTAPFYIVRFDEKGRCVSPQAFAEVLERVEKEKFTDVMFFSHGWNNDWKAATERYDEFIKNYQTMVKTKGLDVGRAFRPLLVGIFWPSTALVMPWEKGIKIAAAGEVDGSADQEYLDLVGNVAGLLKPEDVEKFYELATKTRLDEEEGKELAGLLGPVAGPPDDVSEKEKEELTATALSSYWREVFPAGDGGGADDTGIAPKKPGFADGGEGGASGAKVAGPLDFLNPRNVVRAFTVWQMKDRAGTVGSAGVHDLLRGILQKDAKTHVHLIGHSYGAKVVLSATCAGPLPRKVESALLLEPAVNGYCFSSNVAGGGFAGGYQKALGRVRQPILLTFSRHDQPLTKLFHLAVKRKTDVGEVKIAGGAPNKYAALGGFGAQGLTTAEGMEMKMLAPGKKYPIGEGTTVEVIGLDGSDFIDSHGGITNEAVTWALFCQVQASLANA